MAEKKLTDSEVIEIAEKILENYSDMEIARAVDDQILDYVDENWEEEGFESEYDWYCEYGRGEAEDDIINGIVSDYENDNTLIFEIDTFVAIGKYIAEKEGINY